MIIDEPNALFLYETIQNLSISKLVNAVKTMTGPGLRLPGTTLRTYFAFGKGLHHLPLLGKPFGRLEVFTPCNSDTST